jgi:hypothetical protein
MLFWVYYVRAPGLQQASKTKAKMQAREKRMPWNMNPALVEFR